MAGRNRRPVEWQGAHFTHVDVGVGDTRTEIVASNLFEDEFTSPTVVRVVGNIQLSIGRSSSAQPPADAGISVKVGIGVFHDGVSAGDVTGIDFPEQPWLWSGDYRVAVAAEQFPMWNDTGAVIVWSQRYVASPERTVRIPIDSSAMRRVRRGENLSLFTSGGGATGTIDGVRLTGLLRALIKE